MNIFPLIIGIVFFLIAGVLMVKGGGSGTQFAIPLSIVGAFFILVAFTVKFTNVEEEIYEK
jgi:hypothetical protein